MVLSGVWFTYKKLIPAIVQAVVLPPLLALLTSSVVIALLIHTRAATLALDHPNQRSLHAIPTPRLGGLGIAAGVVAGWGCVSLSFDTWLLVALGILTIISLLDDFKTVAVALRLAIHLACALLAMATLLYATHGIWVTLAAALATTWMINLYNFMDGADGLAGGMTFIGFGAYGTAALMGGDYSFAAINLAVAAAALGFLWFNFPPARVFMGDVGAIPLGYLAAVLGVVGWLRDDWPLWFGAVVFSPFIVDATVTLLRRAVRGAKIWQAHREHCYQQLVQGGWGHRKTALAEYGLMMFCGSIAIAGMHDDTLQLVVLVTVPLLYAALIIVFERTRVHHSGRHA